MGEGQTSPKKSITKMYGSTLLALRGGGLLSNFQKKALLNPLDPTKISENPSEILGKSQFWTICFFHNNLFNIEYLSLQVTLWPMESSQVHTF